MCCCDVATKKPSLKVSIVKIEVMSSVVKFHSQMTLTVIFYVYAKEGAVVAVIVCYLDLQLPMQSVPFTTDAVSLNLDQGEVYNSDLQQVGGFFRVLRFPQPIKLTATIYKLKYF